MANKDVAASLSRFTGYYKGTYYHNGEAQRPQQESKPMLERIPPEDASIYEIFLKLGVMTEDVLERTKKRR